jgi:signal transduction histidine kinase
MGRPDLFAVAEGAPGDFWIGGRRGTELWRHRRGRLEAVGRPAGRLISLMTRNGALWVSIDRVLLTIDPDGRRRIQGAAQGIASGGPLLIDREGGLWLGTFVGLLHMPEPDTFQWTAAEGLPSDHVHALARAGDTVWIDSWQGGARLSERDLTAPPAATPRIDGGLCADGRGGVWFTTGGRLLHWRGGRSRRIAAATSGRDFELAACLAQPDGRLILATSHGLYATGSDELRARRILGGLNGRRGLDAVWREAGGALWLADDFEACRFATGGVLDGRPDCLALPRTTAVYQGYEAAPGVEWLPLSSGLAEISGGRLRLLPGNADLPGTAVQRLAPARSGGFWAFGPGVFLRIAPCAACAAGWSLLESPGPGAGLPGNSALDAVETEAGDLWVGGNRGVFRIPAEARRPLTPPERLVLVNATLDGRSLDPTAKARVGPEQHRLELRFAALSFRDPGRLVYRYRLNDRAAWSAPTPEAVLQLIDQAPGRYHVQVEASLDRRRWTAPARFDFVVDPPWPASWPARLAYVLAVAAALWLAYHLRVRHLLSLQRQRLGIAMDLHDELGSSLSAIGALAQVAGGQGLDSVERRRIADEIVSAVQIAGAGLRALVWTMRDGPIDAQGLGREIADQARRLAPAASPRLVFDLPSDPGGPLFEARVRRDVLMVLIEAMHNALRHAEAGRIDVALAPAGTADEAWRLRICDDGRGFDPARLDPGAGLENMRRRAERIGGRLAIRAAPGRGAAVTLTFAAGPRPRRSGVRR